MLAEIGKIWAKSGQGHPMLAEFGRKLAESQYPTVVTTGFGRSRPTLAKHGGVRGTYAAIVRHMWAAPAGRESAKIGPKVDRNRTSLARARPNLNRTQ